jgi:hypothetical protein
MNNKYFGAVMIPNLHEDLNTFLPIDTADV